MRMFEAVFAIVVLVLVIVMFAGCQSTGVNSTALANAAGMAAGAAYASQGSQLDPATQKVAKQVVDVFGKVGASVTAENVKDMPGAVDKALVENIKDEKQLQQARGIASTLLGVVGPYMTGHPAQDSALIFAAFARGVSVGSSIKI